MQGILMPHTDFKFTIELTEDMLGTVPKDKQVYSTYVAEQARKHAERAEAKGVERTFEDGRATTEEEIAERIREEIETTPDFEDRGWTGFHTDPAKGIFIYDYLFKGFLCEAARTVREWGALKQLQDKVKRHVFVSPRRIFFHGKTKEDDVLERPIRAMTPKGPRVALVRSDLVRAGTQFDVILTVLEVGGITIKCLDQIISYGFLTGLGQWRTGSWGRFKVVSKEQVFTSVKEKKAG